MTNKFKLPQDPRYYQVAVLVALFTFGQCSFAFGMSLAMSLVTLATALLCQWICCLMLKVPVCDLRSPLISGLSLCILLRTNSLWLAMLAAAITIASKFVIRRRGSHIFNPTNFGIVVLLLVTDSVWLSPGQWGSGVLLAVLLTCSGILVLNRAARSDVTFGFLGAYIVLLFLRAWYLGDPLVIPLRQLQSGAILIFAFFMISDPKTTPQTRAGRLLFAGLVAVVGVGLQYNWYMPIRYGVFYALALMSPFVLLINRFLPGQSYAWIQPKPEEEHHDQVPDTQLPVVAGNR
jgi:Na+-transporting NADH:ubiquinone oxidoreductase subunit NqrB